MITVGASDPWFDSLYEKYSLRLCNVAATILHNYSVAEELVQDAFLVLLANRHTTETYEHPYAFLLKVLKNLIGSEMQRASYKREEPLDTRHESLAATEICGDRLEDILPDWLSEEERQFLLWRLEDRLSFQEIALRLNTTEHACHARMYRLREKFKKKTGRTGK